MNKLTIIVQARLKSTRFPRKVFELISGKSLLERCLESFNACDALNPAKVVAVPDEEVEAFRGHLADRAVDGWSVIGGSETDVLGRYLKASRAFASHLVCRATSDNPFLRTDLIVSAIERWEAMGRPSDFYDLPSGFAYGAAVELFSSALLEQWDKSISNPADREHVTVAHRRSIVYAGAIAVPTREHLRLTFDTPEDLGFLTAVAGRLNGPSAPSLAEATARSLSPAPILTLDECAGRRFTPPVVVTGGCFDLLHAGHLHLLTSAARLGGCLIVALNSDASVSRLKGPDRPIRSQSERAAMLAALSTVDAVVTFDDDHPGRVIEALRPAVFVKDDSYAEVEIPEQAIIRAVGGRIHYVPRVQGVSTSEIINRIRE